MAHFRKYYANNTALSFSLPPRSTIMGMLAAMLGLERDEYYEALSSENLQIGIQVLAPVKKSFHRLNYLMVKGKADLRGRLGRIQVPVEVVTGLHPAKDFVEYRLYVAAGSSVKAFNQIKEHLLKGKLHYALSFGAAPFAAQLTTYYLGEAISLKAPDEQAVTLHSAVPADQVLKVNMASAQTFRQIEEELMPADFVSNGNREVKRMNRLLFSTDGQPLSLYIQGSYYTLQVNEQQENICFLS